MDSKLMRKIKDRLRTYNPVKKPNRTPKMPKNKHFFVILQSFFDEKTLSKDVNTFDLSEEKNGKTL